MYLYLPEGINIVIVDIIKRVLIHLDIQLDPRCSMGKPWESVRRHEGGISIGELPVAPLSSFSSLVHPQLACACRRIAYGMDSSASSFYATCKITVFCQMVSRYRDG